MNRRAALACLLGLPLLAVARRPRTPFEAARDRTMFRSGYIYRRWQTRAEILREIERIQQMRLNDAHARGRRYGGQPPCSKGNWPAKGRWHEDNLLSPERSH